CPDFRRSVATRECEVRVLPGIFAGTPASATQSRKPLSTRLMLTPFALVSVRMRRAIKAALSATLSLRVRISDWISAIAASTRDAPDELFGDRDSLCRCTV